ncbi:MAG: hypothetical protein AAGI38_18995, partial [Bacteroidota bacterium]
ECFSDGITTGNLEAFLEEGGGLDLLIDECDSLLIKFLVRKAARSKGIPVLMETSDRGLMDIERFDLAPDRELLHGYMKGLSAEVIESLSPAQRVGVMLPMVGGDALSPDMKASLVEWGSSLSTWPQLASAVNMGGAAVGEISRKLLLGASISSGRYYFELNPELALAKTEFPVSTKRQRRPYELNSLSLPKATVDGLQKTLESVPSPFNSFPVDVLPLPSGFKLEVSEWGLSQKFLLATGLNQVYLGFLTESAHSFLSQSGVACTVSTIPNPEGEVSEVQFVFQTKDHIGGNSSPGVPASIPEILDSIFIQKSGWSWQEVESIPSLTVKLLHLTDYYSYAHPDGNALWHSALRWSEEALQQNGWGILAQEQFQDPAARLLLGLTADIRVLDRLTDIQQTSRLRSVFSRSELVPEQVFMIGHNSTATSFQAFELGKRMSQVFWAGKYSGMELLPFWSAQALIHLPNNEGNQHISSYEWTNYFRRTFNKTLPNKGNLVGCLIHSTNFS